jgi:hypothetical protein
MNILFADGHVELKKAPLIARGSQVGPLSTGLIDNWTNGRSWYAQ